MGPSRNEGARTIPNYAASLLCMVGVCCMTWEFGRQVGGNQTVRASLADGNQAVRWLQKSKPHKREGARERTGHGDGADRRDLAGVRKTSMGRGRAVAVVPTRQAQAAPSAVSAVRAFEKESNRTASEGLPGFAEDVPEPEKGSLAVLIKDLPAVEPSIPVQDTVRTAEADRLHPDRFWKAYAADRYSLLTRGVVAGNGDGGGSKESFPALAEGSSRIRPTKYLVFVNTVHGLGNHMAGMMSAFVLSIATERVFLHDWVEPRGQVAASYDQLFVPPFEPWDTSAAPGSPISGADGLLPAAADVQNGPALRKRSPSAGQSWMKAPEISAATESKRCRLEFTPTGGVTKGHFNDVFLHKRGQDPRPDCPVLFVFTNQTAGKVVRSITGRVTPMKGRADMREDTEIQELPGIKERRVTPAETARAVKNLDECLAQTDESAEKEIVSSPAYGSSEVGGIHISEWLRAGRASKTLFHGLFRPLAPVRQRIQDQASRLFPRDRQTMAAHARSFFLGSIPRNNKFVGCLQQLALSHNISTVLLASDMNDFDKFVASKLKPRGINVVMMKGVQRSGEGAKMRNTLEKIQMALTEMMLVGKADIVVTSPRSSFSALAAASGGESTQRFGGISCKPLLNDPEFHSLECAKNEWRVEQVGNPKQWDDVYHLVDSNRARCKG